MKFLIGGSPCTHWSIAQSKNREIEASGEGWELFRNFLIAKEKFKPDYFLYENNHSISKAIKEQITKELGVEHIMINSALVSAQNRKRCYWTNIPGVKQPGDRGILLQDILDNGQSWTVKSCTLTSRCCGAVIHDAFKRHIHTMAAEPNSSYPFGASSNEKSHCLVSTYYKGSPPERILERHQRTHVAMPVRIGTIENTSKNKDHDSKQYRVYSPEGKATTLCANGGGVGAKTGLYAVPIEETNYEIIDEANVYVTDRAIRQGNEKGSKQGKYVYLPCDEKTNTISAGQAHNEKVLVPKPPGSWKTVYTVKDGQVEIKGKLYPIKLADGYYIIRKLTVAECCRLQTLPDDYCRAVSNTQAYKGLGNGWTAEVIIHILNSVLSGVPRDEEIKVLSMYDGIGTGRYCFDKLGFNNIRYFAYEIDKYAIKVAKSNYPDIVQCGDAFQVREEDWIERFKFIEGKDDNYLNKAARSQIEKAV